MMCKAHLITIGDEILIGQVVDTNASYIASVLTGIGVSVLGKSTIGDHADIMLETLSRVWEENNLVVITGGLGPTNDDITKKILLAFFHDKLVHHAPTLERIKELFKSYGREINDAQYGQAMLPSACEPLPNALGTAPGMWFNRNNKVLISLPGVPYEMKGIMEKEALPRIQNQFSLPSIYHKTLLTMGIGESYIAEKIKDLEEGLPNNTKLAYLPHSSGVRLRLTCTGTATDAKENVEKAIAAIEGRLTNWAFGYNEDSLAGVLLQELSKKQMSIATAESCTGGFMAHLLTGIPGASASFKGSIIAYHEESKTQLLDVSEKTIEKFGIVSCETAEAMAEGVAKKFGSDVGVSSTGIAGPGGGSELLPIGTVCIAVYIKGKTFSQKLQLGEQRNRIIERASNRCLLEAYQQVKKFTK